MAQTAQAPRPAEGRRANKRDNGADPQADCPCDGRAGRDAEYTAYDRHVEPLFDVLDRAVKALSEAGIEYRGWAGWPLFVTSRAWTLRYKSRIWTVSA